MNFTDAIVTRQNIKRAVWNDEIINVFLRFTGDRYKMIIEHTNGKCEEHDYKLDISDLLADDWITLKTEFKDGTTSRKVYSTTS